MKQTNVILLFFVSLSIMIGTSPVFAEETAVPDSVLLLSPANRALDIVTSNNFLEWSPSTNAISYTLLLTREEDGIDTVIYEGNLGTTFYILPSLEENTIYYWKIRAENSVGASPWSELRQFRTVIPDGEALVIKVNDPDSLVEYVAINTQTAWGGNFFYSKVKSLSKDGSVIFNEQDFPVLFAQDFKVQRVDFVAKDGKTLVGHIMIDYLFTYSYPRTPRKDILVSFYKKNKINPEKYPNWKYYASSEVPIVGLIPPGHRFQSIRPNSAEPVLLVNGISGSNWGETARQLYQDNLDTWQFLYADAAPIDSSAILLSFAVDYVSGLYDSRKVGVVAHSSGGLVVRAMIQRNDYKENVSKLLVLGTPNFGSYLLYKKTYTNELNDIGNQFVQGLDRNSPLLAELSPASTFLFKLNAKPPKRLNSGLEINQSYLSIAGVQTMPLGIFHNEVANEEDGVVSVASAGLMQWDIPLATVKLAHTYLNSEDTTKNLLKNSEVLIRGFFNPEYSPVNLPLSLELAVDGFWLRPDFIVKSDGRSFPGKSLMEISLPGIHDNGFTLNINSEQSQLTIARKTFFNTSHPLELFQVPETSNYFAAHTTGNDGLGLSLPTSPQTVRLADWIEVANSRMILKERIIPIALIPGALEFQTFTTTMKSLSPRSPIMKSWFLGVERREEIQIKPSINDTLVFDVDTYMDTMVIARFLPPDSLNDFLSPPNNLAFTQSFRLIAPNGVVIDTNVSPLAIFLPYSGAGYQNYPADNVSYYFMAQPQPGRWKIISAKNQNAHFVQSYLSEVAVRIAVSDSLYKPNDTVPFKVFLPKFFFSKPKLSVRVFSPNSDSSGTDITLIKNDTSAFEYSGTFYPTSNGIYRIAADFTCDFPAGPIHRTASRNIEIIDALPNIPELVSPPNNAKDIALNTTLEWKRDTRTASYQIQFSTKQKFTELLSDTVVYDLSYLPLPKLKELTTYYWRVRGSNRRGWTPWSEPFLFTTNSSAITTPLLKSPAIGTVTIVQNLNLSWSTSFRAKVYRLQISRDSLFKSEIVYDSTKETTNLTFAMQSNTKYYWRVKAIAADKGESEWSQIWNFKRLLPSPSPILPENQTVNLPLNIKLKWYSPDLSLRFQVQISSKKDFSALVFNETTLGDTIIYAALPSSNTTFYWRVKWIFGDGAESEWSEVWSFTTMLAKPRLDSPGDKVTGVNLNPTLTWNSVPGGVYYHLQLARDAEFTQKVFEDSLLLVIAKPLKSLSALTEFFWRVRSRMSSGASEWSDTWSFKTGEAATGVDEEIETGFSMQVTPQPSSGVSFVELQLLESSDVTVSISDLLGRVIQDIPHITLEAGKHSIPIVLPMKGMYSCKVTVGTKVFSRIIVY